MKKLFFLFVMAVAMAGLSAQTINFAVLPIEGGTTLDETTQELLQTRLKQILTRNSAGAAGAYCVFGVQPQLDVTDTRTASGVSGSVSVAKGVLTLIAMNVVDGSLYHSAVISLTAQIKEGVEPAKALVQNVKVTDKQFTKFVRLAKQKIEEYYAENCSTILQRAQALYKQGKFEEAAAYLAAISESVPCYEQASEILDKLSDYITEKPDTIVVRRPVPSSTEMEE